MSKKQFYIQKIREHYPNLVIESAEFNQDGQYNDVLIVNASLIFRFAKVQAAISTLRREIIVLRDMLDHISLRIPKPIYVNIEPDIVGDVFVGYEIVPGEPLWRGKFAQIVDSDVREKMADQLASFLQELHQIDVSEIISADLPHCDQLEEWTDLYQRIQDKLYPYMRPDAQRKVTEHFESYFNQPQRYFFEPRLRHGDFGQSNIIYNPETQSIAGIIDFGSIGIGDRASDFAGLFISYGEAFYKICSSIYPEMEGALDRAMFYCGTFALQEALFGIENDDRDAFQAGMNVYI
jgi:aminoglycoside 2''-phosphotransferase